MARLPICNGGACCQEGMERVLVALSFDDIKQLIRNGDYERAEGLAGAGTQDAVATYSALLTPGGPPLDPPRTCSSELVKGQQCSYLEPRTPPRREVSAGNKQDLENALPAASVTAPCGTILETPSTCIDEALHSSGCYWEITPPRGAASFGEADSKETPLSTLRDEHFRHVLGYLGPDAVGEEPAMCTSDTYADTNECFRSATHLDDISAYRIAARGVTSNLDQGPASDIGPRWATEVCASPVSSQTTRLSMLSDSPPRPCHSSRPVGTMGTRAIDFGLARGDTDGFYEVGSLEDAWVSNSASPEQMA